MFSTKFYNMRLQNQELLSFSPYDNVIVETTKTVVVECGQQAADWVAVNSCLNLIEKILEEQIDGPFDGVNWIVLPLINPDGYDYRFKTIF